MFCCRYCPCCYYVVIIPGYYFLSLLFLLLLCCYHSWPLLLAVVVMVVLITSCRRCSHCRASQRSSGRCLLLGGCSPSQDCNCKSFHRSKPTCPRRRCQ